MANAKDLRKRITSVKNTQQITKAMKMVSAAKLRRAQDSIVSLRPYAESISKMVSTLAQSGTVDNPCLDNARAEKSKSILVIVVSSDRGLCGGFNAQVIKALQRFLKTEACKYEKCELGFIGKKAYDYFKNKTQLPAKYYQNFFTGLRFAKSQILAEELISQYTEGKFDEVKFIYNEFQSAISQKITVERFLPISLKEAPEESADGNAIIEPKADEFLNRILPKHFATQVHRVLLESLASEHGARMAAMENATKNAGEMIYQLTLDYNKTRQTGITKELLEIVSGSEAQNA